MKYIQYAFPQTFSFATVKRYPSSRTTHQSPCQHHHSSQFWLDLWYGISYKLFLPKSITWNKKQFFDRHYRGSKTEVGMTVPGRAAAAVGAAGKASLMKCPCTACSGRNDLPLWDGHFSLDLMLLPQFLICQKKILKSCSSALLIGRYSLPTWRIHELCHLNSKN